MTPNQITGIAAALRAQLESGHRQGLTTRGDRVAAVYYDPIGRLANVVTHWREPEGEYVSLGSYVERDGSIYEREATLQP